MATPEIARERRAELYAQMGALAAALAEPIDGRGQRAVVGPPLDRLRAAFEDHVTVTAGPGGLFEQIASDTPRLVNELAALHREHGELRSAIAGCDAGLRAALPADRLRRSLEDLLVRLARHRRRGADLLFEAYQVDVGGE